MKNLFTLLLVFFTVQSFAQTVENIRVEQDGENLKIHYRIGGSTAKELYFVTLHCSIDGAAPFEPKSVIGDVGANIRGGKSFNTIVWDVFEDVEEIGSVEFFVKVDLTSVDGAPVPSLSQPQVASENKEVTTNVSKKGQYTIRTRFIGLDGSTFSPLGLRMGSLMNWGYQFSIRYGYDGYFSYASLTAAFTKRFFETR